MHVYTQYVTQLFVCRLGCDVLGTQGFFMFFFVFWRQKANQPTPKINYKKPGKNAPTSRGGAALERVTLPRVN